MLSVVVPVLNECKALPRLLAHLHEQQGEFEIIVVDGGSTDATPQVVQRFGQATLLTAQWGRGAQMNAGARAASGDVLLFLHADTRLPPGGIATLQALLQHNPHVEAGAFRHRFEPTDWRLGLVSAGNNLRCRMSRIYFGDQAIFSRKATFERAGGFPEVAILEDVIFCERLRRFTSAVLLDATVTTDSRRFLHHGVWRTTLRGVLILLRHSFGLASRGFGYTDEVR